MTAMMVRQSMETHGKVEIAPTGSFGAVPGLTALRNAAQRIATSETPTNIGPTSAFVSLRKYSHFFRKIHIINNSFIFGIFEQPPEKVKHEFLS